MEKSYILTSGDPERPEKDKPVQPGWPFAPAKIDFREGRIETFSDWLTAPENPMFARVAVNRLWQWHFGEGLLKNTSDFGGLGGQPSHPALLDWLASEFMREGWSLKKLHRLLVTSAAYRRDSASDPSGLAKDPENRLLWRMNVRRMESEVVRDSVLSLAGSLDPARGGPELDQESALTTTRRSLYYRHAPEKQAEFLRLFDAANVNECYERSESIIPQQALALANSSLVKTQSRALAARLGKSACPDEAFAEDAFLTILGRKPSAGEREECAAFLRDAGPGGGREGLVRVLFNHNDFVTIR
jgi:hypothetical protein